MVFAVEAEARRRVVGLLFALKFAVTSIVMSVIDSGFDFLLDVVEAGFSVLKQVTIVVLGDQATSVVFDDSLGVKKAVEGEDDAGG